MLITHIQGISIIDQLFNCVGRLLELIFYHLSSSNTVSSPYTNAQKVGRGEDKTDDSAINPSPVPRKCSFYYHCITAYVNLYVEDDSAFLMLRINLFFTRGPPLHFDLELY